MGNQPLQNAYILKTTSLFIVTLFSLCMINSTATAAWQIQTVSSTGNRGMHPSLAFDGSGNPAISFGDVDDGNLRYVHDANGNGNFGAGEIITVDSSFDGPLGTHTSLAFDGSGNPAISYYDSTNDDLKFAHFNGTSWVIKTVDSGGDVGAYTSLAFDSSGNPAIAYYDHTNKDLKYAHDINGDGNFSTSEIITVASTGDVGLEPSLAFDGLGFPAISYRDSTNGDLKYAHVSGTTVVITTVDSADDVGWGSSLAFNGSGNPAISYFDSTNTALKYANDANGDGNFGAGEIITVDSAGVVGLEPSLAFDGSGNPAIAYRDHNALPYNLKFAYDTNGDGDFNDAGEIIILDTIGEGESTASLAFDGSGNPAIAYTSNTDPKYAHFVSGTTTTVTSTSTTTTVIGTTTSTSTSTTTTTTSTMTVPVTTTTVPGTTTTVPGTTTTVPGTTTTTTSTTSSTTTTTTTSTTTTTLPSLTWAVAFGDNDSEGARGMDLTSAGDSVVVVGGKYIPGVARRYAWVSQLNSFGDIVWSRIHGDVCSYIYPSSVQQTSDGGYVVAGYVLTGAATGIEFWVSKLDSNGNVQWQKTYGGNFLDEARSIQQTSDGGYVVAGNTHSFGSGLGDVWVLKLDSSGNVQWQKTFGGYKPDNAWSIQQTSDGGYVVAGTTSSFGAGLDDFWVLKLDSGGNIQWQKTYGGIIVDKARSIQQTSDGGYVVAGETISFGAGFYNFWVLKLDSGGNIQWQKTYGGNKWDIARSIQQTSDGGYVVAGETRSFGVVDEANFWVLKLCPDGQDCNGNNTDGNFGEIELQKTYGGILDDGAWIIQQTSDDKYVVAGYTTSFGAGLNDFWVLKLKPDLTVGPSCDPLIINDTMASGVDSSAIATDSSATVTDTTVTPGLIGLDTGSPIYVIEKCP